MGECSIDSELFDLLDYLISPVNKSQKTLRSVLLFSRDCQKQADVKLVTDFRKKIKQVTSPSNRYDFELHPFSLASLKKRTEELGEQYSVFNLNKTNKCLEVTKDYRRNYTGIHKPMIEITVIPKVTESKVFNKRREKTKKLQSTVSNQEHSIKNQNIYFTVKGKRHEKVYELKTTESANLSKIVTTKYEDISTKQISNSKRLINSLSMEKIKRKNKKNVKINNKDNNFGLSSHNRTNDIDINNLNPRKSKVTIVGQLGLTCDDHYVLKCAATVNDKPITTNLVHIDNNASVNGTRKPTNAPDDSNIQTDENRYSNRNLKHTTCRMASQATQVNFNQVKNIKSKDFKGQIANCNCRNTISGSVVNMENNAVKGYESPLVIISVYPRKDRKDNMHNSVKIIRCPDVPKTQVVSNMDYNISKSRKVKPIKDNTFSLNKAEPKLVRRRSPSPASKTVHNKVLTFKTDDKNFKKNNGINTSTRPLINRNASPERLRNVNKSKEKLSYMTKTKDKSCDCSKPRNLSNLELLEHSVNSKVDKKADTKEVKRALVNNFIKNIDKIQQHDRKLLAPKDTSRISINIDGEKDRYDVLFEKRNFDTGLTIRKTLKKYSQTNSTGNEIDVDSMENFLMLSDEMKGTNEAEIYSRESCELTNLLLRESRLNVRDSLELCYSRQGRVDSRLNPTHIRGKYDLRETSSSTDLLAPVKHFRGDNCTIPDPTERDTEIRELLGIVSNKRKTKTDVPVSTKDRLAEIQREKGCCCKKKCSSKGLTTGLSMSKFFASKCLKKKNKKRILTMQSTKRACEKAKEVTNHAFLNKKQETDVMKSFKFSNVLAIGSIDIEDTNETSDSSPTDLPRGEIEKAVSRKGNNKTEENSEKVTENVSLREENITTKKEEINNLNEKLAYEETLTSTGVSQGKPDVTDIIRQKPVIEQNLILNRNIQVFLQVAQFTKQRPIILTRKQYNKVKKTIQCTISKNLSLEQCKRCNLSNCNVVSIHKIKIKPRLQRFRYNREVQTEWSEIQRNVRCIYVQTPQRCKSQITKVGNSIKSKINHAQINKLIHTTDSNNHMRNVNEKHLKPNEDLARQTVSSMEVRYANVKYMKHLTISTTQFGDGIHNTINCQKSQKHSNSIHTLFKGPKKCVTPNLGTSAYSLYSDVTDACSSSKSVKAPPYVGDPKPKKPFLQRLISCLVMRSAETSMLKEMPVRKPPSVNSSVDSYHISTSLGALEMTSSLYDTSASFYTNHTTWPLNKMKRGFFSSVRGLLTTRRS